MDKYFGQFISRLPKEYHKKIIPIVVLMFIVVMCIIAFTLLASRENLTTRVQLMQDMENSYSKFRTMTPKQLHDKFMDVVEKYGDRDDITSLVFNELGAAFRAKDYDIGSEVNTWIEFKLCHRRYNYHETKPGDFIMFKPKWVGNKQYYKACVVQEYRNGYIKYIDHDMSMGLLFPVVSINDPSFDKVIIHEMSIWIGDRYSSESPKKHTKNTLYNGTYITRGIDSNHFGVDMLLSNYDRSVDAFQGGKVVYAYEKYDHRYPLSRLNTGGNYCIIRSIINGKTYYFQYMHLVNINVSEGQWVKKGDFLGQYADVGYSFGAHLHLGVFGAYSKQRGPTDPFDPLPWVYANASFVLFSGSNPYNTVALL
jgi:hypothetical protein